MVTLAQDGQKARTIGNLTERRAQLEDLPSLIRLLFEDELGQTRESKAPLYDDDYIRAFDQIDSDRNQYLMVVEQDHEIVGMCHLTMIPSLTFKGRLRMQIEGVRVSAKYRGQGIGTWMMNRAILYAQKHDATILQLTTNKQRKRARAFYERMGFESTHEGMKLYLQVNE